MKRIIIALISFLTFIAIADLFIYASKENSDAAYQNQFNAGYKVYALNLPKNLNFAGDTVPINRQDIAEAFDKELLQNVYFQSQTIITMKRANRWFKLIEKELKTNGIPSDFKYIVLIESNLTNVISPAGATGFWQFMPVTAIQYGLEINDEVDERYSVIASTRAACKYFLEAYKEFQNWTLVAASYNMGIGGIKKQIEIQKSNSYYDLILNQETARYIYRALAVKEIFTNPQKYGYYLRKKDLYTLIPHKNVLVDSTINDIAKWAIEKKSNYKFIKLFNPWLRKNTLTIKNKSYIIKIPNEKYISSNALLPLLQENKVDSDNYNLNYFGDSLVIDQEENSPIMN